MNDGLVHLVRRQRPRVLRALFVASLLVALLAGAARAQDVCTYHHTKLRDHPNEADTNWSEEAQGLTQDDRTSWYVTNRSVLYRVPVEHDLATSFPSSFPNKVLAAFCPIDSSYAQCEGRPCLYPSGLEEYWCKGYDHFGDPDYFERDGQGYVFVPLEGVSTPILGMAGPPTAGVIAFTADASLDPIGFAPVERPGDANRHAPLVTLDPAGFLYLSERSSSHRDDPLRDPTTFLKFTVGWDQLAQRTALTLTSAGVVRFLDEQGRPMGFWIPQGADFSSDGSLLYVLNGNGKIKCATCGIHVFEVRLDGSDALCHSGPGDCTARRVARSTNGSGSFNYEYHPGCCRFEEPEGLTYWDLDAPGAPIVPGANGGRVGGQVHAMLLDNDLPSDDIYIKHYRLEPACQGDPEPGIAVRPTFHDFGRVPVGGGESERIAVRSGGIADLSVSWIELAADSDAAFSVASAPATPLVLPPQTEGQIELAFVPLAEGPASGALEIESDDPDTPLVRVELEGFGVGLAQQARDLVHDLDEGLASGDLVGSGPAKSAAKRAGALRNMLVRAAELIEQESLAEACVQLRDATNRIDGAAPPGDFVQGEGAPVLAHEIEALRTRLGQCT